MRQITIEPQLESRLLGHTSQVILCDEAGRVLGFFSPMPDRPRVEDLQLEPPEPLTEAQRQFNIANAKPLEEILSRLNLQ